MSGTARVPWPDGAARRGGREPWPSSILVVMAWFAPWRMRDHRRTATPCRPAACCPQSIVAAAIAGRRCAVGQGHAPARGRSFLRGGRARRRGRFLAGAGCRGCLVTGWRRALRWAFVAFAARRRWWRWRWRCIAITVFRRRRCCLVAMVARRLAMARRRWRWRAMLLGRRCRQCARRVGGGARWGGCRRDRSAGGGGAGLGVGSRGRRDECQQHGRDQNDGGRFHRQPRASGVDSAADARSRMCAGIGSH
jgi:hypothetical protein